MTALMIPSVYGTPVHGVDPDVEEAARRFEREEQTWRKWTTLWEDCYEFCLPNRDKFYSQTEGDKRDSNLSDMTGVVSTHEFASRLHSGVMPPFVRWAEFRAGSEIPAPQRPALNVILEEIAEYVFEILRASNFDSQIHEAFLDLAVGTGSILVEEGEDYDRPIRFTAVPLTHCVLGSGPYGDLDAHYRIEKLYPDQLMVRFPQAAKSREIALSYGQQSSEQMEIVHATWRDWTRRDAETWRYLCWLKSTKETLHRGAYVGYGSCPWVSFRWSKAAGETYGRGPVMSALPAVKTANLVVQLTLDNADMAIAGMYNADDDGTVNVDNIRLVPGMVIPRAPGSRGLEPIRSPSQFDVSNILLKELRGDIKKALYDEMLGPPEGTPMSATEVRERMADMARRIGSPFVRLQTECVQPLLRRVIHILSRQGRIRMPKLNGHEVKVQMTSPLARAQEQDDVRNVSVWLQMIAAQFGPEMLAAVTQPEEIAAYAGTKLGVPQRLIRDPRQAAQILARMQQAQLQQAQQSQIARSSGGGPPSPDQSA